MQKVFRRMIEIWIESVKFDKSNQRLADPGRMILKKGWFSDLEILEIWRMVSCEEYAQNSCKWV